MRIAGILAAIALSLVAARPAHADAARAWAAARAGLPADTKLVISIDVAAVQKTQLFATYYPKLRDKPEAARVLDALKSCKLDPLAIVQGVVLATAENEGDGAVYVALSAFDRGKLSSCVQASAKAEDKDAKVAVKNAGNVTEVTRGGETAYFGWAGKDVLVMAVRNTDKAALAHWMGGKGALAKSDVGKALGKVNTAATVWAISTGAKEIQPGVNARGVYGSLIYSRATLNADVHAVLDSPAQAQDVATTANQQLAEARGGPLPPSFSALLDAMTIAADKDEVRVKANVAEQDVLSALAISLATLGGP